MNTKKISNVVKLILFLFLCLFLFHCNEKESENIKIGILSPSTGASATHGIEGLKGAEMALSELKKNNNSLPIKYIVEDTQSQPLIAVSAANKLIELDKVRIIVGWLSSSDALAVAPICEKNKVLFFAIGTSTSKLSGFGKYIYRHAPLSTEQAESAAKYITDIQKAKRLGVLYMNDDTGRGYYNSFVDYVKKRDGEIYIAESYEKTSIDFRTQIAKIKERLCDIIYIPCVPRTLGYILKQLKELSYYPKIVSNFGAEGQELIDIAGENANGIIYTSFKLSQDFIDTYKAFYNKSPEMLSALSYDSMKILFEAMQKNGSNPDGIINYLKNMKDYQGVTGKINFNNLNDAMKEIVIKTVKNKEFVIL